jgi:dienelactone hydrolase
VTVIHRPTTLTLLLLIASIPTFTQDVPTLDRRHVEIRHLDLTYNFPGFETREEWIARSEHLRKQILFSAGLWPMPEKRPIKPTIYGKVDRGDFTIEKVYFESHPGFYVTGNLYRPKNIANKLPAVLCPHGHWTYGRLENSPLNSGPARAANFARQGYVAFSYDMIGFGDNTAISHQFADHNLPRREVLWGINLLGLQLWNSIRSLDFLLSLPEVDPERIGCTGESGGGTQTFLLMAVDNRVKVAAPVNMISFHMQGGSLCENAPNLRIDTNNVEIGAMMAPRPLMLVSATGDWTKNTMTAEYPAIRNIYRLFGAEDKVTAVQMDAPHNYNQESREAVYGWFAHWLLGKQERTPIKERGGGVAPLADQMVFIGHPRPQNELDESRLSAYLIETAKSQLEELQPSDNAGLNKFRNIFGTALRYSLMVDYPEASTIVPNNTQIASLKVPLKGVTKEEFVLSRRGKGDRLPVILWKQPATRTANSLVLVVSHEMTGKDVSDLVDLLLKHGHWVAGIQPFPGGRQIPGNIKFTTTYNRTDEANRIQDILTAIAYFKKEYNNSRLSLVAQGRSGLYALLARGIAPKIDKMLIDAAQLDTSSDEEFLKHLPIPGLRRAGDFLTAVTIAPLSPLLIHNTGDKFRTEKISAIYNQFGRQGDFKAKSTEITSSELLEWLSRTQ